MTRFAARALASLCCSPLLFACAGQDGPPRHPVAEMSARASAKIGVIELVVSDAARAERLRQVYLRVVELAHEFDLARAQSLVQARALATQRSTAGAEPVDAAALEHVLAPPLAQSKALFERYAALMLEARSLVSADEFDELNRVR